MAMFWQYNNFYKVTVRDATDTTKKLSIGKMGAAHSAPNNAPYLSPDSYAEKLNRFLAIVGKQVSYQNMTIEHGGIGGGEPD